ncbi:hypothetical protein BT69DRAFT_1302765 [Atractiella rhizophila]|nr:hypothetical protein BT69DRAFT_1302765 [Atractiella rhizophila]
MEMEWNEAWTRDGSALKKRRLTLPSPPSPSPAFRSNSNHNEHRGQDQEFEMRESTRGRRRCSRDFAVQQGREYDFRSHRIAPRQGHLRLSRSYYLFNAFLCMALDQPSSVVYDSLSPNMSNDCSYPLRSAPDISTTVSNDGTESSGWEVAKGMRKEAEGGSEEQEERQGGRQAVVKVVYKKFKQFEPNLKVLVPSGS